jgi:hypothetical protein
MHSNIITLGLGYQCALLGDVSSEYGTVSPRRTVLLGEESTPICLLSSGLVMSPLAGQSPLRNNGTAL